MVKRYRVIPNSGPNVGAYFTVVDNLTGSAVFSAYDRARVEGEAAYLNWKANR